MSNLKVISCSSFIFQESCKKRTKKVCKDVTENGKCDEDDQSTDGDCQKSDDCKWVWKSSGKDVEVLRKVCNKNSKNARKLKGEFFHFFSILTIYEYLKGL